MKTFFRKLDWLARRRVKEEDLGEELRFHLDEEAEELRSAGMSGRQAHSAARRGLGNMGLIQENTRAAWGWTIVEQFGQDLRYAFRTMAANKLFSALAVLSLALGIGANTAIYSFMDKLLLRSLPVREPERLVLFNWRAPAGSGRDFVMHGMSGSTWGDEKTGENSGMFPYPAYELLRKNTAIFSNVFAYYQSWDARQLNVMIQGQSETSRGEYVSGEFFAGLGVPPAAGRLISPDDDRPGAPPVVVLSHALAEARFGGADKVPGQTILINNLPFTVAGVTPPGFFGVDPGAAQDLYLPMHTAELLGAANQFGFRPARYLNANYYWVLIMGRLGPGVSLAQAQAVLSPQFHHWVEGTAKTAGERARLPELTLRDGAGGLQDLRRRYSQPLLVLLILVGLILVIACANVANLLLARAAARCREMALRLSVGASRSRVIRQLLTESVLLAALGGALGVAIAVAAMRFLTVLLADPQHRLALQPELNWHVLAVAAALSVLTGMLFGLAPALQATRVDVMPALKEARAGRTPRLSLWGAGLSRVLVAGQIGVSLLMLVAAGLFLRTLANLQSIELGFNQQNLLLFHLDAFKAGHKVPEIYTFLDGLRRQFAAVPGVRSITLADSSMLDAGFGLDLSLPDGKQDPKTRLMRVGPAFFSTMQIPLRAGRDIEERDRAGAPAVAVINEAFAQRNFPGRNPIGQRLLLWKDRDKNILARDMEIVGVSHHAQYGGLKEETFPVVYFTYDQGWPNPDDMVFELRTAGEPLRYVNSVRDIVHRADPRVPIFNVKTEAAEVDENLSQEIALARLSPPSRCWRWRSPAWASMGQWLTQWRGAPAKSESAWRSAPNAPH
jgi:macrolide transport system ATP-binding/permease protein